MTDETTLWLAVIERAFLDALGAFSTKLTGKATAEARHWFRHGGADFEQVCHGAGLEPDRVRRAVEIAITTGTMPASIARKAPIRAVDPGQARREAAIVELRRLGLDSVQIAARLEQAGIPTKMGKPWRSNSVREALDRLGMGGRQYRAQESAHAA